MGARMWTIGLAIVLVCTCPGVGAAQVAAPAAAPSQQLVDSLRQELHRVQLREATGWDAAHAESPYRHFVGPIMTGLVFIVFFAGLFTAIVMRQLSQRKVYLAAIERGVPVPLPPAGSGDARRSALVMIAIGCGFAVAAHVTLPAMFRAGAGPSPWTVSIWGVIPVLVGVALLVHGRMSGREQHQSGTSAQTGLQRGQ